MFYTGLLLPEPGHYEDEKQLADSVLTQLASHFEIQREVPGRYPTGQKVRLDAVLRPLDPKPWYDDNPVFGVEFKSGARGGDRDDAAALRQAVDYSYSEFEGYGRLGIFLCPSPAIEYLRRARDVIAGDARLAAEENTIEYHRRWAVMTLRATGSMPTDAKVEAEARKMRWQAMKRRQAIEAGARAEGFRGRAHRDQAHILHQAGFFIRVMGGFGVGELLQHRTLGWTLLRSGERLWSQSDGFVRRQTSLRPRLGSRY